MSIDEAYLDLSGLCQAEDPDASLLQSRPLAQRLKQRILTERHLTATIGIAANKRSPSSLLNNPAFPEAFSIFNPLPRRRLKNRLVNCGRDSGAS